MTNRKRCCGTVGVSCWYGSYLGCAGDELEIVGVVAGWIVAVEACVDIGDDGMPCLLLLMQSAAAPGKVAIQLRVSRHTSAIPFWFWLGGWRRGAF